MSDANFETHKEALAAQRLEKPKQMLNQSAIYWAEITSQQYNFDRANIEVAYLRTITKNDIINFYNVSLTNNLYHLNINKQKKIFHYFLMFYCRNFCVKKLLSGINFLFMSYLKLKGELALFLTGISLKILKEIIRLKNICFPFLFNIYIVNIIILSLLSTIV